VRAIGDKSQQALLLRRCRFGTRDANHIEAVRTRRLSECSFDFGEIALKPGF
jgi:hypothetical protein